MSLIDRPSYRRFVGILLGCCLSTSALAVDGVIEINQARALAGGVTPGDAPGFPVTINEAGSYVLTSNLVITDPDVTGIKITVADVSLDLNGFFLRGPVSCGGNGSTLTCTPSGTGFGIDGGGGASSGAVVKNGGVRGFASIGVIVGPNCLIDHLVARSNGGTGIFTQGGCVVTDSTALRNSSHGFQVSLQTALSRCSATLNKSNGIQANSGSTVTESTSSANGGHGIWGGSGTTISANASSENEGAGINAALGSLVKGNTVYLNDGPGLSLGSSVGYTQNVISSNLGGTVAGGVEIGTNLCDTNTICP